MTEGVDFLGKVRSERSEEVKRERNSFEPCVLALHHCGGPLQTQLNRRLRNAE